VGLIRGGPGKTERCPSIHPIGCADGKKVKNTKKGLEGTKGEGNKGGAVSSNGGGETVRRTAKDWGNGGRETNGRGGLVTEKGVFEKRGNNPTRRVERPFEGLIPIPATPTTITTPVADLWKERGGLVIQVI